jgi:hypothetical protein
MRTFFFLLNLLTDRDAIRSALHSCFTAALVSVAVLFLLGTYQVIRRSCLRRNRAAPSRTQKFQESWEETKS